MDVAFAKLSAAVRRNELVLLASLLAGLVMALVEMAATWATGGGLWAFPGYVAATVFRSLQAGGTITFTMPQIALGLALHLVVAVLVGSLFAWWGPRLREATGLDEVAETPAFGLLGLGFGAATFAVAWYGILPYANPLMVQGLDPTFFGVAHGVWGLSLGVTRKAWNQTAPQVTRQRAAGHPQPTPAASSHKAPSSGTPAPPSPKGRSEAAEVETLQPQQPVEPTEEPETDDEDETEQGSEADEPAIASAAGSDDDELSPWPDPPDPSDDEDEPEATDEGYASPDEGSGSSSATSDDEEEEDEEETLAMTEHARRSLRGLTDREPDLPPVHEALNTTLTHVAPGRAVCTIDADERLHDATGAVQSGVLISLAELAATIAMETVAPDAEHATVGSEIQVEGFVEEGHVVAEAEVTEQAGTTTLAEAEVRDASGQVLVKATFQAASADE